MCRRARSCGCTLVANMAAANDGIPRATPTTDLAALVVNCKSGEKESERLLTTYLKLHRELGLLDINERDDVGFSPLHWAVATKQLNAAKLLVKYGADVNLKDTLGFTPLFYATGRAADLKMAKYLIEECAASVHVRTAENSTCLHGAALVGEKDIVKLLLKHGMDPQAATNEGTTPFDVATDHDVQLLLHKSNSKDDSFIDKIGEPCANCGMHAEKLKRCSRCHVTLYCGKDCQKKHWKDGGHKKSCEEGVLAQPSRYPYLATISHVLRANQPTVSLHGGKTSDYAAERGSVPTSKRFVVKVQRPLNPGEYADLMVYNIDKSVHVFIREETPGYVKIIRKITEEGIMGIKAFFWAVKAEELGPNAVKVFPGKLAPKQDW